MLTYPRALPREQAACDPAPLFKLTPPYTRIEPAGGPRACAACPDGTLLALRLHGDEPLGWWARQIDGVRRALPRFPIVLLVSREPDPGVARLVCQLGKLGVHSVLGENEPIADTLRPMLTHPVCLARDVVDWLRLRALPLNPELEFIVHGIFEHARHSREVSAACQRFGEPGSSARARFRKKGLPPPSAWHQAARALYASLRIQGEPDTSLTLIAWEHGYGSHASLSRQFVRVFGLRPSSLRETLGWEWLLARWHARAMRGVCP